MSAQALEISIIAFRLLLTAGILYAMYIYFALPLLNRIVNIFHVLEDIYKSLSSISVKLDEINQQLERRNNVSSDNNNIN